MTIVEQTTILGAGLDHSMGDPDHSLNASAGADSALGLVATAREFQDGLCGRLPDKFGSKVVNLLSLFR